MQRTKKKALLIFIAVFFVAVGMFFIVSPIEASARIVYDFTNTTDNFGRLVGDLEDVTMEDDPLVAVPGASMGLFFEGENDDELSSVRLRFSVKTRDENFIKMEQEGIYRYYVFLVRDNEASGAVSSEPVEIVGYSRIYNTRTERESVQVAEYKKDKYATKTLTEAETMEFQSGSLVVKRNVRNDFYSAPDSDGYYKSSVYFEVPSYFNEYTVVFITEFAPYINTTTSGILWWRESHDNFGASDFHIVKSDRRSVKYIAQAMDAAGDIEDYVSTVECGPGETNAEGSPRYGAAMSVFETALSATSHTVDVSYLKQIGNAPFAEKITTSATIKYNGTPNTIPTDDVEAALGIDTSCLLSTPKYYERQDNGSYMAVYPNSVWLEARTVDGNRKDFFLDLNLSYKKYFHKMVDDGVFSEDLYEYIFFTQMYNAYPELKNNRYQPENVYGYFGYVVIPTTYTWNEAFKRIFDTQTQFAGLVKAFDYPSNLSLYAYETLLDEYNYSWLEQVWNGIAGFVEEWPACHYLLYADCTTNEAGVFDNGDKDSDDGLVAVELREGVKIAVETVTKQTQNLLNKWNANKWWIITIILIVAAVLIYFKYVYPYRKITKTKRSKKK